MARLRRALAAVQVIWFLGSATLCPAQTGQAVTLEIHPQKAPREIGESSLLPPEKSLIDGDALQLYEKAIKALPDKAGDKQIRDWLNLPIDQLPVEQVEQTLTKYMDSLKSVAKAAKCRQCNWPPAEPGKEAVLPGDLRRLASVVRLWARLETARQGYEGAILALQTGFGMGRHLGQAPTIIQTLNTISIDRTMCVEVEEFVQRDGSPNLYFALASLPRPFVNAEIAFKSEAREMSVRSVGKLSVEDVEKQVKADYDRVRLVAKGVDVCLAALQGVEAIRSHVGSHGGQLPETLAQITATPVPGDPISGGSFRYTRTGSTATLESALPPDGNAKLQVRYEISVKN